MSLKTNWTNLNFQKLKTFYHQKVWSGYGIIILDPTWPKVPDSTGSGSTTHWILSTVSSGNLSISVFRWIYIFLALIKYTYSISSTNVCNVLRSTVPTSVNFSTWAYGTRYRRLIVYYNLGRTLNKLRSSMLHYTKSSVVEPSVADPDPGSGIGCFLTPGSGIRDPE